MNDLESDSAVSSHDVQCGRGRCGLESRSRVVAILGPRTCARRPGRSELLLGLERPRIGLPEGWPAASVEPAEPRPRQPEPHHRALDGVDRDRDPVPRVQTS
jgi:hypothetical protein